MALSVSDDSQLQFIAMENSLKNISNGPYSNYNKSEYTYTA